MWGERKKSRYPNYRGRMVRVRDNIDKAVRGLDGYWKRFVERDFIRHQRLTRKGRPQQQKRWRLLRQIRKILKQPLFPRDFGGESKSRA